MMFSTRVAIRGATLAALASGPVLIGAPFVQAASAAPSVVSESASQITASSATLEATIATQPGEEAINQFQLATSPGGLAPEFQCPRGFVHSSACLQLNGETPFPVQFVKPPGGAVSEKLAGVVTLSPSTTYYYRILTAKTMETLDVWVVEPPVVFGATQSFTTPPTVPPIKAFPKFFFNGKKLTTVHEPAIGFGSAIRLENNVLGAMECESVVAGVTYNETTEGTEKGLENTTSFMTYECKSSAPCTVKNTKGEEVEGIYATAESPPEPAGTEAHPTGISSLPWTGEAIERETGRRQILAHHVKVWFVLPPASVGKGNCQGLEVPFEEKEGPTEKEAGYELAPTVGNGTKNGLKPSGGEFLGESGLTEKKFPITGRLKSPVGDGFLTATKLISAGLKGGWELITVE